MSIDMKTKLGALELNNPIVTASGTFGSKDEYAPFTDFNKIGAITTKSVTFDARVGNPAPRIWETSAGMMNAIGLENKGIVHFIENNIPYFAQYDCKLIVSIAGNEVDDYERIARELSGVEGVHAIEINISCPNVKHGGIAFIRDYKQCCMIVESVKKHLNKPVFVKISPEAPDMVELANELKKSGADGITLINTLKAMAIDINTRKPRLGNVTGGLSGPAIKPVALRYVYEMKQSCDLPVIAGGGILTAEDALEFIIAGAEAVSLGTANFVNPCAAEEVAQGIADYCEKKNVSLDELRGSVIL